MLYAMILVYMLTALEIKTRTLQDNGIQDCYLELQILVLSFEVVLHLSIPQIFISYLPWVRQH